MHFKKHTTNWNLKPSSAECVDTNAAPRFFYGLLRLPDFLWIFPAISSPIHSASMPESFVGALGATLPDSGVTCGKALAMEAVLAAGLVSTILGTASGARNIGTNGTIAVGVSLSG